MRKFLKFIKIEILVFLFMGLITMLEITNFNIFETFFGFIKTPSSWFVGIGLAYALSNLLQTGIFSFFSRRAKGEEERKGDYFVGFLITLIVTALISPFIKEGAVYFFGNFFIYFHIILMQCIIILYVLFKLKEGYEMSAKYFLINEAIVLLNTLVVLQFIA
jgi:hypothetical protein